MIPPWLSSSPRSGKCLLLGLCLLLWAGCQPTTKPLSELLERRPFEGQQALLVVPAGDGLPELWDAPLREWGVQTGGRPVVREYPRDDQAALQSVLADGASPAVTLLNFDLLADVLADLDLERLPESSLSAESGVAWEDLLPGIRDRIGGPRRKPQMVPLRAPLLVCYYRSDLLEQAGLKPPVTWDDYSALLARVPQWGGGLPAVEPWSESFRVTWFLSRAVSSARHPDNYSVFVDLDSLKPMIDNTAFTRALEQARTDVSHLSEEIWQLGPLDCRRLVLEGKACLGIGLEPQGGANGPTATPVLRAEGISLGICALPAATAVFNPNKGVMEAGGNRGTRRLYRSHLTGWEGLVACVFKGNVQGSSVPAWNALSQVAGSDWLSRLPPGLAGLTRESQLADASWIIGPELSGTEAPEYLATAAEILRDQGLVLQLPFPRRSEFARLLSGPLMAALQGQQPAQSALEQVASDWQSLITEIGPERFRRSYRQLLGLGVRTDSPPNPRRNTPGEPPAR